MATTSTTATKVTIWTTILGFLLANWSYILLVGGLITGAVFAIDHQKEEQAISELHKIAAYQAQSDSVNLKTWKDKYGAEHLRAQSLAVHDAAMSTYADSVAKLLKIKPNQVFAVSKLDGTVQIKAPVTIDSTETKKVACPVGDTVKEVQAFDFHWNDTWTKLSGRVGIGGVNQVSVDMTDTLKYTQYWSRAWFLGSKRYYTDFTNSNPHVHLTGYKSVQLASETDNEKQWSVGPAIGIGYGPGSTLTKPAFWAGITLQYRLIKF